MSNQTLGWKIRLARGEADFGRLVPFAGNTYPVSISGGEVGAEYAVYVMDDYGRCLAKTEGAGASTRIALNGAGLYDAFSHAAHELRVFHAYVKDASGGVVAEGDLAVQWQPLWEDVETGEVYTMRGPAGDAGKSVGVKGVVDKGEGLDGARVYEIAFTDGTSHEIRVPRGPQGAPGTVDYGTVVRTVGQTLTAAERERARANIAAASAEDVAGKVDAVPGKGLSSNDLTDALKQRLVAAVQSVWLDGVRHPVDDGEGGVHLVLRGSYAPLEDGKVPIAYLPGRVSEITEAASLGNFPARGDAEHIYVARDTGKIYRWSGTAYVEISASLALGETSATAFPGNRGRALEDGLAAETVRARDAEGELAAAAAGAGEKAADAFAEAARAVSEAGGKVSAMSGSATNLRVGTDDSDEPALSVNGFVDAYEGFDVENGSGIYFYARSGANKDYIGNIVVKDGFVHWIPSGSGTGRSLAFADGVVSKDGANFVGSGFSLVERTSAGGGSTILVKDDDGKWYLNGRSSTAKNSEKADEAACIKDADDNSAELAAVGGTPRLRVVDEGGNVVGVLPYTSEVLSLTGGTQMIYANAEKTGDYCRISPYLCYFGGYDSTNDWEWRVSANGVMIRESGKTTLLQWPFKQKAATVATLDDIPIKLEQKTASFAARDGMVYHVAMPAAGITVTMPTPVSGEAGIFMAEFDGTALSADAGVSFSPATVNTYDDDCGTVKAGKLATMNACWNGSRWSVVWKNQN